MIDKKCGKKLNQRRKELGLKVDELADLSCIQPGYMRQILSGYVPSIQVLLNICKAMRINTDYIFEINGDNKDAQILERIHKLSPQQKELLIHLLDTYIDFNAFSEKH